MCVYVCICVCVCEGGGFISTLKSHSIPTFHPQPSPAKWAHTHTHTTLLIESSYFFLVLLSGLITFCPHLPCSCPLISRGLEDKIFLACVCVCVGGWVCILSAAGMEMYDKERTVFTTCSMCHMVKHS